MKYGNLTLGQIEAGINKIGGEEAFLRLLAGKLVVMPKTGSIASSFARDMTKEGWTLLEDVSDPSEIVISSLELVSFLNQGERYVSGDVMKDRAKQKNANLGQRHAEYLLQHHDQIPAEWRNYHLVFPGTVWQGSNGYRYVPCLSWYGARWYFDFGWRGDVWDSRDRALCPSK